MTGQDQRMCDYCGKSTALLYCRADSAKLCFHCDKEVHATNQLFTKHSRSLLCDFCDDAPASFFCETERSVLCHNCDWDRHNSNNGSDLLSSVSGSGVVHSRRPIEWFNGCPGVSEMMGFLGFDKGGDKVGVLGCGEVGGVGGGGGGCGFDEKGFGYEDMFVWDTPSFLSLDDLVFSSEKTHDFKAVDVPPLPKNRNAICGQHKEDIIHQLCALAKSESNSSFENIDVEPLDDLQVLLSEENLKSRSTLAGCIDDRELLRLPEDEVTESLWFATDGDKINRAYLPHPSASLTSYCEISPRSLDKLPDDGPKLSDNCHERIEAQLEDPMSSNSFSFPPRVVHYEISSQERESAITRYKEKKKTRRYEKHVRYASRKARAESRTRIRGRFAKMDH